MMSDKRQWTASTRIGQALLCLMVVVLSGCSNTSTVEGRLKDYADRVQRVTGISISESHSNGPDLLHYPRRRDRLWSKKESNIGLLDFVALADCELQQLVGQRNSGLGAVMPVSQRLLYEHRFIASAPRCIGQLEIGSRRSRALAKRLEDVVEAKKKELPKIYWNATFGSPEFEKFFSLADGPLSFGGESMSPTAVADALRYLIALDGKLGHADFQIQSSELEHQYKQLQATRHGGRVLRTLHLLTSYLELVANNIDRRLEARAICPNDNVSDEARIMQNIFNHIYGTDIQPYVARVHRETRSLMELTHTLAASVEGHMPPQFMEYYRRQLHMEHQSGLWTRFERSILHHASSWQALLDECGLPIGTDS